MTFKPVLAAIAAVAVVTSGAAFADVGNIAHVRYGDLDLASTAGQKTLDHRIDGALTQVCGVADAGSRFAVASCRADAARDARDQLRKVGSASF